MQTETHSQIKHSPLPWFANEFTGTEVGFSYEEGGDIVTVADLADFHELENGEDEAKANAAIIARAVNNHVALVSSLATLIDSLSKPANEWALSISVRDIADARAALAAATR